jgi:hypothetical protein
MGRVKDKDHQHDHIVDGLSEDMKGFVGELEQIFPELRYTSGKRNPEQKIGKNYKHSHHNTGDALDLGAEHKDVYEYLYNTKEGLGLLTKYGLGVIDETDPKMMAKTGATGAHFHIGKDTKFAAEAKKKYEAFQIPVEGEEGQTLGDKQLRAKQLSAGTPFEIVTPDGPKLITIDPQEFEKELAKVQVLEEKVEGSKDRQAIEQKKQDRINFLKEFNASHQDLVTYNRDVAPVEDVEKSQIENLGRQDVLPELPSL